MVDSNSYWAGKVLREVKSGPGDFLRPPDYSHPPGGGKNGGVFEAPWIIGVIETPAGSVAQISRRLAAADRLGGWRARWGIGRMGYRVPPGLYGAGNPGGHSPVLVTANYKMSFDALRSGIGEMAAWILVLDTRGINVWCAAGKGTFGTGELVNRIGAVRLHETVSHRKLILPQLGAPGVSAHQVARQSGFQVIYGPVRARDIPPFIAGGEKATERMRRVEFTFRDRLVLVPVELTTSLKYALPVAAGFLLLSGMGRSGYSLAGVLDRGMPSLALLFAAILGGVFLTPLLLPWLPGRAFSLKGAVAGFFLVGLWLFYTWHHPGSFDGWLNAGAWLLIVPAVSSFLALNFTGSSTYTSLSGVRREMGVALPIQIAAAAVGLVMWLSSLIF